MGTRVNGVKNNLFNVVILLRVSLPLVRNKLPDCYLSRVNESPSQGILTVSPSLAVGRD